MKIKILKRAIIDFPQRTNFLKEKKKLFSFSVENHQRFSQANPQVCPHRKIQTMKQRHIPKATRVFIKGNDLIFSSFLNQSSTVIIIKVRSMKRAVTRLDKLILLCRNVQKTSSIYSQTLGLRVVLQSPRFVELRDNSNFSIYLQQSKNPSQLSKGYSPILSFHVEHFDDVYNKLIRCELIPDGQVIETKEGKLATFQGLDGETISINSIKTEEEIQEQEENDSIQDDQIKRLLEKIKI